MSKENNDGEIKHKNKALHQQRSMLMVFEILNHLQSSKLLSKTITGLKSTLETINKDVKYIHIS